MSVVSSSRRPKSWQIADEIASLLDVVALDKEQLGAKLRALARAHPDVHSDEDAARLVGVSYRQYQRWLSGESEPRTSSLKLIAEKFGVPVGELLGQPDPSQLDRIEGMLSRQGELLDALLAAGEVEFEARAARAARRARQQARGTPRAADPRRKG